MPTAPAPAARVDDNVKHTEAQEYRFWGAVGTIAAVVAGVAVAAGLGVLEVGSFGLATPLVVAGGVLLAGGMTAVLSGQVADVAADAGRKVMGPNEGPIKTGIPTISIGGHAAAYLGSYASCNRDKHGSATSTEVVKAVAESVVGGLIKDDVSFLTGGLFGGGHFNPAADWKQGITDAHQEHDNLEQVLQGSSSVFYGMGGKKYHAARVGDKGTCGFTVGEGCPTVLIGGDTVTEGEIGTGDDPDKHITDLMKEWGGKAALAGIVLITLPVGIEALADLALNVYIFSQVQGAIDDHIKDPEMRHKVDLAITVLTLGYGASKAHGGAVEDGSAAEGGGGGSEPVGESGEAPADGGGESVDGSSKTAGNSAPAETPAAASDPAANTRAGRSESTPPEANPVHQIGEDPGGSDGTAPPEQAGGEVGGGKPAETPDAAGSGDPVVQQGESPGGLRAADESGSRPDLTPEENFPGQQSGNNCAPQSCQQIIRQATGNNYTEAEMEQMGQDSGAYDPDVGTTAGGEADILKQGGVDAHTQVQTPENIQKALDNGQGVITGHDAATLWEGDPNYEADPANPVNGGHAVHTTGLVRDADGNVTHYVINDTGTGTSGRMVPADQFHQSLDTGPAVVTDAPIRTPTAAREAAPTVENAPASPEGTTVPRDAASRGDPASEEGDPASEGAKPGADSQSAEGAKLGDMPEASGEDANAAGDGDPTVQTGDRPGGLKSEDGEDGSSTHEDEDAASTRGARRKPVVPDDTMDQWAKDYADKVNSDETWGWQDADMDSNILNSMHADIKQRAVDQGLIPNIPIDKSTTLPGKPGFADFTGSILKEVQMPEFVTNPDGSVTNLWLSKDPVQFRWLNDYLSSTDPNYSQDGGTWHHNQGGSIDEGDSGPGRPDGTMQLVRFGIHNITNHAGARSAGGWADAPR